MKITVATLAALFAAMIVVPMVLAESPAVRGGYVNAAKYNTVLTADDSPSAPETAGHAKAPVAPPPVAENPFVDAPSADKQPATSAASGGSGGCNSCGNSDCQCGSNCQCAGGCNCGHEWNPCWCKKLDCPDCPGWTLFGNNCALKCHDLTINGWIDGGYTANMNGKADHFNGTVTFNDRADEFEMNQLYVSMAKAVDPASCCWQWGGKVDLLYGTDARFTKSIGLELDDQGNDRWNSHRFYQLSMPQLYAEFGRCNWDIKIGHFYTIVGYEVATAPDNFFYSKSYCYETEPVTHTGALVTRKVNDQFSVILGYHRGWNQWEDFAGEDGSGVMAGMNFNTSDNKQKLALAWIQSDEIAPQTGVLADRNLFTAVYTYQICDRLTFVTEADYGVQQGGANNGANVAEWYGSDNYLFYQLNCCWWAGIRAEWFTDDDGTIVNNTTSGNTAAGPFPGTFTEVTVGLNYKPNGGKNLMVRPEVRWDKFDGTPGNPLPFDNGTKDNQVLLAIDAIFKY